MNPRYGFAFDERFRLPLAAMGVNRETAYAEFGAEHLLVRFGRWSLVTRYDNIEEVSLAGPYAWYRAIGVRLSLKDRGLTFGSNAVAGVCLRLAEPVPGIEPLGLLKHPNLTLTLDDLGGFMNTVEERRRLAWPRTG